MTPEPIPPPEGTPAEEPTEVSSLVEALLISVVNELGWQRVEMKRGADALERIAGALEGLARARGVEPAPPAPAASASRCDGCGSPLVRDGRCQACGALC